MNYQTWKGYNVDPQAMRDKRIALKKEGYLSWEVADQMEAYAKELGLSTERRLAPQKAPTIKMGTSGKERPDLRNWMGNWTVKNAHGIR